MLKKMKKFPMTVMSLGLLMTFAASLVFHTMWPFLAVVLIILITLA